MWLDGMPGNKLPPSGAGGAEVERVDGIATREGEGGPAWWGMSEWRNFFTSLIPWKYLDSTREWYI